MDTSAHIKHLREKINDLQKVLSAKTTELHELTKQQKKNPAKLTSEEVVRYSRQIILPEIAISGQLKLRNSSVLIVGAGGLGCPAVAYLAGAGIGNIGIVDYDEVELTNLHRQILHRETTLNSQKVESIRQAIVQLNSQITVQTHAVQLSSGNAMDIIRKYDVVLDCTDNVATRYLLNDACVMSRKPLVSGSALQFEGQLIVYNCKNGPCYRCIFPIPPPSETVTSCGDGGVLGAVPGVIGTLQALEAIKIVLGVENILSGRMLLFDGLMSSFRNVKMRPKRTDCTVCSANPTITELIDYEQFCGMKATDKNLALQVLEPHERATVEEFKSIYDSQKKYLLVDVRTPLEFEMCHIEGSTNVPLKKITSGEAVEDLKQRMVENGSSVFFLCRRGNDSQIAVKHMRNLKGVTTPRDIIGGLHAWHKRIDPSFPLY